MKEVAAVPREQISIVTHLLRKHGGHLYADIWEFGINVALRISDLLSLRMGESAQAAEKGELILVERKTGKSRRITLNVKAVDVIRRRVERHPQHEWLFQSDANRARGTGQPIRRQTVARKFREVGEILGVDLGTHSMRKTRGYALYSSGVPVEIICKMLNHSSPAVTMRYIGIDAETVARTYGEYVL